MKVSSFVLRCLRLQKTRIRDNKAGSKNLLRTHRQPLFGNVGVLAFVPEQWSDQWQPRHHVLTRLARYFHVVWINPAQGWREVVKGETLHASTLLSQQPPGFQVYDERWLPKLYRPYWLAQFTGEQRLRRARRLLLKRGCKKIVLYIWRPEFDRALETVEFDLCCYHVDDEYSFSDSEVPITDRERRLIAAVDRVFIHSPGLMEKKGWVNPKTTFVPNGVDYEAYSRPQPEPPDIAAIPHPRIGYSGWIKKTLDWPLLLQLARSHPEWSFVFVGENKQEPEIASIIREMLSQANVHFLGTKTTAQLATYPRYFDVCIMPYRLNDYTRYIYPMKLHEYLASGKPTVASRVRSLESFFEVVDLPDTIKEWSFAISKALEEARNKADLTAARQRIARQYDWSLLVARIAQAMRRGLAEKKDRAVTCVGETVVP